MEDEDVSEHGTHGTAKTQDVDMEVPKVEWTQMKIEWRTLHSPAEISG